MKAAQDKQSEQERVSSQAKKPKDNQNTYTDEETSLAEKYHVEPKLIRMIGEIVGEHTSGISELINLMRGEKRQETEPEQAEPQEQPEQEQPTEPCIDQQTQERLKTFYKNLDPRTKLAIATLSEIQALDGINFQISKKEGKIFDEIWSDIESICIETFHREPDDVADIALGTFDSEDVWLSGFWEACRMVLHNC